MQHTWGHWCTPNCPCFESCSAHGFTLTSPPCSMISVMTSPRCPLASAGSWSPLHNLHLEFRAPQYRHRWEGHPHKRMRTERESKEHNKHLPFFLSVGMTVTVEMLEDVLENGSMDIIAHDVRYYNIPAEIGRGARECLFCSICRHRKTQLRRGRL